MAAYKARDKAFTIVELLTVVTILSILVTMLTPYLTKAREIAKRAQCLSNQRNIAEAVLGFAATHNGRAPGGAGYGDPTTGKVYSSVAWCEILNAEWYRNDTILRGIWQWPLPKNQLICPDAKLYAGRWYTCLYQLNMDAAGGPDWHDVDPTLPTQGVYGVKVDPATLQALYPANSNGPLVEYNLGAQVSRFRRPDYTFLVIESEHANSTIGASCWPWSHANAIMNGVTDTSYPPWGASGGDGDYDFFGFRHTLPPDYSLYQGQATACFSFIDGHVAIVNPDLDLCVQPRFYINP